MGRLLILEDKIILNFWTLDSAKYSKTIPEIYVWGPRKKNLESLRNEEANGKQASIRKKTQKDWNLTFI